MSECYLSCIYAPGDAFLASAGLGAVHEEAGR
jgi:hypothetical protein